MNERVPVLVGKFPDFITKRAGRAGPGPIRWSTRKHVCVAVNAWREGVGVERGLRKTFESQQRSREHDKSANTVTRRNDDVARTANSTGRPSVCVRYLPGAENYRTAARSRRGARVGRAFRNRSGPSSVGTPALLSVTAFSSSRPTLSPSAPGALSRTSVSCAAARPQ